MNPEWELEFLTREIVDAIHDEQINAFGGLHGVRDENALESAIAEAMCTRSPRPTRITSLRVKLIWTETRELARRRFSFS
jgi:hypothetical protein